MKKTFLTLSGFIAVVCCTLVYAANGFGSLQFPNNFGEKTNENVQTAKVQPAGSVGQILEVNQESFRKNFLKSPLVKGANTIARANRADSASTETGANHQLVKVDLWNTAHGIGSVMENDLTVNGNSIVFNGSADQKFSGLACIDESGNWGWPSDNSKTYVFKGHLEATDSAKVYPYIGYINGSSVSVWSNTVVYLNEDNNYSEDFYISGGEVPAGMYMLIGYVVEDSTPETVITATNNEFYYEYETWGAQKWTAENDLPGLGITEDIAYNAYTVVLADEVTTLGLYYDGGNVFITGINTTADTVLLPKNVTIDGVTCDISYLGWSGSMDWSGAASLNNLYLNAVPYINTSFENAPFTDLYINTAAEYYGDTSWNSNIYLHIPYGFSRRDYTYWGFKRVLVGNETPEYPEPEYSNWVIAGENEGEYFGITVKDNAYCIAEVFTENDSVALPLGTPADNNGGLYYIRSFGYDSNYNYGTLCKHAPNLTTVTIPASYTYIGASWNYNPIVNLHMQGAVPSTYWRLPSTITVYVANQAYYSDYESNSNWNSASILPDGWDFEWMTVNVTRKGEFAQTYIEMTDADWSLGMYVKVTGKLNTTDLENIKNLTNLRKLDLSEAEFDVLPNNFLDSKSSLIEVILPESLTVIPSSAFRYCYGLTKVTAPGVKTVDSSAFYYCNKLATFDISNVTTINQSAFYECNNFNPKTLSSELKFLGSSAFYNTAITEVKMPEGITSVPSSAFSNCSKLTKVELPSSLTYIDSYAFSNCTNLVEINLPEGITSIQYNAFSSCSKLTEIIIPSTVESIGSGIFNSCSSLTSVKCKAIVPPTTGGNFTSGMDLNHCTLYIAPFTIDAYRAAQNWSDFYIMKPLDEPVKNIYINRPMTFDLLSEDNAVLQENPNMTLDYSNNRNNVGQLTASGDGTLSAGVFKILHSFASRQNSFDYRTTLVNNAENMRADSVICSIYFSKNTWHFISFQYDVKMSDIYGTNNTDYVIREYNSANRAMGDGTTSNWENVPADGVLKAGKGYIIQAANNTTNENGNSQGAIVRFPSRNTVTKNRLFTSNNVIVPLEEFPAEFAHNRSWNLVGNPYPCYYDMHYLMDDFTTPIVLWRGSSYQAYSPVDDDIILRPNEAFFVQRPLDVEQMVFGAEGRMHYTAAYNANTTPGANAPARVKADSDRSVFNFVITGCGSDDRARIVINDNALMDYEIDKDAVKFFAEVSTGAEIYVDGNVKYDICERPLESGVATLGTRIAAEGEYTISLSGRNVAGWSVILTDTETGISTDLTESDYTFDAEAGETAGRFVVSFKAPDHSAIDGVNAAADNIVRVIDIAGVVVFEGRLDDFKASAQPGVYVVVSQEKASKIVVK